MSSVVWIAPATGGSIASFTSRGREVLRRALSGPGRRPDARELGCFPLVPWSNRVAHARLAFERGSWCLAANFPPEPHAIHGVGWRRCWNVRVARRGGALLELRHEPDVDWPFAFLARQAFRLLGDRLELRLSIRNTDSRRTPVGLGWHPYFPLDRGATLQARWSGCWVNDRERLPLRWIARDASTDFRRPRPVGRWKVDRVFTGWSRTARLASFSGVTVLTAGRGLERIVCFAPRDGRRFIALEPVSHMTDAFNRAAAGQRATGTRVLAPGESWEVAMAIEALPVPGA